MDKVSLVKSYKKFYQEKGRRPISVNEFCDSAAINRKEFKQYFKSLFGIERHIWETFALETLQRISSVPEYSEFAAIDKLLAFYYTFLELANQDEAFVKHNLSRMSKTAFISDYTDKLRRIFGRFIEEIMLEAAENEEVKSRPIIATQYPKLFWLQLLAIMNFWKNDKSEDNEQTDAFVEKSVQLSFDLFSQGPIDSALDLGKFLIANK